MNPDKLKALALAVIDTESEALQALRPRIDDTFVDACRLMLGCRGRVVVSGMGKSGHIGHKIAATLASTGTPAFFMHPGEASHGDLGMITAADVAMVLSNSGETEELLTVVPLIKRLGVPLIALTGNPASSLATVAEVNLDVSVPKEACPLGLAPTASTTATLAMGDALAVALLESRGFTQEDFARAHPGGALGRKLLLHIADIMHTGEDMPMVSPDTTFRDALLEMSRARMGMTAVVDAQRRVLGVFTDGDLRRALDRNMDLHSTRIEQVMTADCRTADPDMLAAAALQMMDTHKINALLVVDGQQRLIGALNMHDLLRAGVV
ncbi:MAG: KpsF/GutQ family sugar-phosphate isomerase [Gammaproteobacteria bacterium]|nr:KpsF/GutQ family sugar-phosphate isomerase [Gammaproteobacteria bacterium]